MQSGPSGSSWATNLSISATNGVFMSQNVAKERQPILEVYLRRTHHSECVIRQAGYVLIRATCNGWVKNSKTKGKFNTKNSPNRLEVNMADACELRATKLCAFHCIQ